MFASLPRCLLLSLVVLSAAACIPIPYKPAAMVAQGDFIETPPTLSVQYVEGEVVTTLAKKIQSRDKGITVVAHKDLEAIAFPEGDITLEQLLEPDRRGRLRQDYGLAYLVLIGDLTTTELSHHGGFIPLLGAGTTTERASVGASVIDLATGLQTNTCPDGVECSAGVPATTTAGPAIPVQEEAPPPVPPLPAENREEQRQPERP